MQKQEIHDKPVNEPTDPPSWQPPPVPELSRRESFMLFLERFGFLGVSLLTIGALSVLFIKSDVLLREPNAAPTPVVASDQPASTSASTGASASLSITTEPPDAAIFVEGEFAGLSPLSAYALASGSHRISVQKQDYISLDTVLTIANDPAVLHIALRAVAQTAADDENRDEPAQELAAETRGEDTSAPELEQSPLSTSTPAEEPPPSVSEDTPADENQAGSPADAASTDPVNDVQADPDQAKPLTPEEPVVARGELQIYSQPSGALVWLGGKDVGLTPLLLTDVEAGAQQVTLRLDGYEPFTTTVDVAPQQRSEVSGALIQRLGTLKILVKPWGNIYIDSKLHKSESSIWYTTQLPLGNHRVRIEHPTLGKWEQVVVVSGDEERIIEVDYNKGNSPSQ